VLQQLYHFLVTNLSTPPECSW